MIMAQLKQLSAGSSQIIMMMFRDKNNAPIKADSVHVKGSIFTGSGKPFEVQLNLMNNNRGEKPHKTK
jgi:hypothetical protein